MFAEWIRPKPAWRGNPGSENTSEILELSRPAKVIRRKGGQQGCGLMIDGRGLMILL